MVAPNEREDLFLDLLRRLSEAHPSVILLKDPDSAFHGSGDLDIAAPTVDWPAIEATFATWAEARGMSPVAVCRHGSLGLLLAAWQPGRAEMFELDVLRARRVRGAHLFAAEELDGMTVMDPRGFRALRPGAEGVLKLLWNGMGYGGARNDHGLEIKHVRERLTSDPDGVRMALAMLGSVGLDVGRVVTALLDGRWDRRAALRVEIRFLLRAIRDPRAVFLGLRFRFVTMRRDPLFVLMSRPGRRAPDDFEAWLTTVERAHEVRRSVA